MSPSHGLHPWSAIKIPAGTTALTQLKENRAACRRTSLPRERAHAPFPPAPDAARSPAPRAHQAFRGHETFTLTKLQSCSSGLRCKYLLTTTIKATLLIDSRVHFLVFPTRRFNPRSLCLSLRRQGGKKGISYKKVFYENLHDLFGTAQSKLIRGF